MKMLYAVGDAAAGPLVKTDHIFRIAIADGQEIAKLALAGGIIGQPYSIGDWLTASYFF